MIRIGCLSPSRFVIDDWAAWASGLNSQDGWQPWPEALPADDESMPALTQMPAMMRRRLDRMGRMALHVAYDCHRDDAPIIFCSRHGDLTRSLSLLRELAESGSVSPTSFSLSVHNAIAALFSIARGDTSSYSAVAAGPDSVEAAFVEALGLLADGAPAVLIVCYEDRAEPPYDNFPEACQTAHAWACRIRPAPADGPGLSLTCRHNDQQMNITRSNLPGGLEALRFLVSNDSQHEHCTGSRIWQWQRHV